jgi:DNA-binding transcriptional LysR family regulator
MEVSRRHLEHLIAVATRRGVTRAAEFLGVTQPSLSRSIQELERLLGVRLFDRTARGVVPTATGDALLRHAREVLAGFGAIERDAQRLGSRFLGEVVIGLGPAVASGSAALEIGRLLAIHPELRCRVAIAPTLELARQLRRHELDFFVADQTSLDDQSDSLALETLEQDAHLYCRAGHPILDSPEPLREVPSFLVAALGPTPAGLDEFRALLREAGAPINADWEPALWLSHSSPLGALLLASDTIGATVPYPHLREIRGGVLRSIPAPRPVYRGRVGPVRLRTRTLSPAAEALWAAIVEALRRDLGAAGESRPSAPRAAHANARRGARRARLAREETLEPDRTAGLPEAMQRPTQR